MKFPYYKKKHYLWDMIDKEQFIKSLDMITALISCAVDLPNVVIQIKDNITYLIEETKSSEIYKNYEVSRTIRNLYAIIHLYLDKIDGRPLAISDDEIKRRLCAWLEKLIERVEKDNAV